MQYVTVQCFFSLGYWTCFQDKTSKENESTPLTNKKVKLAEQSSEKHRKGSEQTQPKPAAKKKAKQVAPEVSLEVQVAKQGEAERAQQTSSPNKKRKKKPSSPSPKLSQPTTVPATEEELLAKGLTPPSSIPQRLQEVCRDMRELVDGMTMEEICKNFECTEEDAREVLDMVKKADLEDRSLEGLNAGDTQGTSWS